MRKSRTGCSKKKGLGIDILFVVQELKMGAVEGCCWKLLVEVDDSEEWGESLLAEKQPLANPATKYHRNIFSPPSPPPNHHNTSAIITA